MYEWKKIAGNDQTTYLLPDELAAKTITVDGKKFCIVRYEGTYYAMQNNCPHAGASLGSGWCDSSGHIVCPAHRMAFDIRTGKNAAGKGFYINTFPLEWREDGLYLGLRKKGWWQLL